MFKRLSLAMCALIPGIALGQAARYDSNVTTYATNVPTGAQANVLTVPNALITVCGYPAVGSPCTNTVNVYSDSAMTQVIAQPIQTDAVGRFGFWILGGLYSYSVQKSDGTNLGTYPFSGVGPFASTFAPAINTVQYVNPGSSTDLVTQVNALFSGCSGVCEVHIPTGNYTVTSGTILMHSALQSLTGDGKDKVRITYAGTNFLDWRLSGVCPGAGCYDFNANGEVSGFTVTCTNAAAQCMTGGSVIGMQWRNLNVYGPAGITNAGGSPGTSQGFVFQNTYNWMERWLMENINIGGFQTNIHFMAPTGGGTDSFGYGKMDGVWTNQGATTQGVVVDVGADVYNMLECNYQFNLGGTTPGDGTTVFNIAGAFQGEGFHVTGENGGTTFVFAHIASGGQMAFDGDYDVFGPPNTGLVVVDTPQPNDGIVPFSIGPRLGSTYNSAGIPLLVNYDGSGESFNVTPIEVPDHTGEFAPRMGYLRSTTTSKGTFYDSFDAASKLCHFTRNQFLTEASLTPVWCVDGTGTEAPGGILMGTTGTKITSIEKFTVAVTPPSIPANGCADQTISVPNLVDGDSISSLQPFGNLGPTTLQAYPSPTAGGQLVVHYCNVTGAATAPAYTSISFIAIH